jgi:hypothetical protein
MPSSNTERIAEILKIVSEIAASVTEASRKADSETGAKLRSGAKTLIEHANQNAHDIDALYNYLRNAKDARLGVAVDNEATKLGARTLAQRWGEVKAIYNGS